MRRDTDGARQRKTRAIAAMALVLITAVLMRSNGASIGINTKSLPIIILLGIVVVAVASVFMVASRRKSKRKLKTTDAKADQLSSLGLTQLEDGEKEIKNRFGKLSELRHKGSIKKVFTGMLADRELYVFSHLYTAHTGQAPIAINNTIYAVKTPNWPKTNIVPTNWFTQRIGALFGRRSLTLDLPEFNRRFRVVTADESFAITLLSPELQQHILDKHSVKWRFMDGWLCLIYGGPMKLNRAPTSLRRLERFVELIPPELESWTPNVSVDV